MTHKPPLPVCPVFLACREIVQEENGDNLSLIGLATRLLASAIPRCGLAEIVWRDGPLEPWPLTNPLEMYDLKLNLRHFPQSRHLRLRSFGKRRRSNGVPLVCARGAVGIEWERRDAPLAIR